MTITDNDISTILLPAGLDITGAQFLSNGVIFTVNGFALTLLGIPADFSFIFGGTPLDATVGTSQTFEQTAVAFGTTVPAPGAPINVGTSTGPVNTDGSVGSGSGGGGGTDEAALEAAYAAAKATSDVAAATAATSAAAATTAQAEADTAEVAVTNLATAQAYKTAADAAKVAADAAAIDAAAAATAATATKTAADATANTTDDTEADAAVTTAATAATNAASAQTTAASEVASAEAAVEANTSGMAGSFSMEFDYRFDTFGFFTAEVRAAMEEVARIWENIIQDEFPDFDAGQTVSVRNPETNDLVPITLDQTIDDLLIFVGSDTGASINMGSTTSNILADAGPSGFDSVFSDLNSLRIANDFRGQGPTTDFEPYIGSARFNRDVDWNFSIAGPVDGKVDFIETALHEIGHVLGIGPSGTYSAFVTGTQFTGPNAIATNSGQPVPLQSATDDHVRDGFLNDTVLMDPSISGERNMPSDIDKALLADIGYEIDGFTKQGTPFTLATNNAESIFGRTIADEINGLAGNDTIQGGDGNDSLSGGAGDDQLFGQNGVDAFYIGFGDQGTTIGDFDISNEKIFIDPAFGFATAQAVLDTLTKPFSNVDQLVLGNGATVSIFDAPSALTTANIEFGVLGQTNGLATASQILERNVQTADFDVAMVGIAGSGSADGLALGGDYLVVY
ncbi:MAG: hypothetical protein WA782_09225 [Sulfitobacter sp.]